MYFVSILYFLCCLCPTISFITKLPGLSALKPLKYKSSKTNFQTLLNSRIPLNDENDIGDNNDNNDSFDFKSKLKYIIPVVGAGAAAYFLINSFGLKIPDLTQLLESSVAKIESLGPYGYLYFSLVYITAEVLAIPVMPLTASSGYLFGLIPGSLVVLLSATTAACISFFVGRTLLRDWARSKISGSSLWRMIDLAVGREGFKIILLLRLSPLLPFAISNYLYGITSVDFISYFFATLIGFAPGTLGIVYAGSAGKALLDQHGGSLPWYAYAGIGLLIVLAARTIAKIATDTVKAIQADEEAELSAIANNNTSNLKDRNSGMM